MSNRIKRTILPFIVFASLILLCLYFITIYKSNPPADPLKAVPVNASLIIKVNDYQSLLKKTYVNNAIWNELKEIPDFRRIDRQLRMLDSLYTNVPEVTQILDHSPSYISAHLTGKDQISLMHVFRLPARYTDKKISDLIARFVLNAGTINERKYEGTTIHEIVLLKESLIKNFSFAISHDILIVSFSAILLEDAIRQLQSDESLELVSGFRKIYSTAGKNVAANIFVNLQQFPKTLSVFTKSDYKAEVRSFKNFANWAEMDVNLLSEIWLMNGFIGTADSTSSLASIFLDQAPQRLTADEILPATVGTFITISTSDIGKYTANYMNYLRNQGLFTGYNNTLQSLTNTYHINLRDELLEILDNEITLAFDQEGQEGRPVRTYILMRIKSKAQTAEKMKRIIAEVAASESKSITSYAYDYEFDNELSYKIYHLPIRKFTAKMFGGLYSFLDEHYFTVLDNYLVFSNSADALKVLIQDLILNKTLQNDLTFKAFKNELSPRSNIFFYTNLNKAYDVYDPYLASDVSRTWKQHMPAFEKVQAVGFQIYTNNNMLYSNFLVKNSGTFSGNAQTVWESKLDTLTDFKPVFVINHLTKQNEVFVQDIKNNIYLISQVGRILWKIQLPEPINSEIFQIDYFRNGKLQLLFSTCNYLYLIDRNGNFVEKYPVKLRSPATCGLSVFDYDNNRDYRLFIACEDKSVYAYNPGGNLVSGWTFTKSESEVNQPVSHFRIGSKDFIVFGDSYKTYILDRKGNARISTDTFFPRSVNNNYLLNISRDGSDPALVTTDTTGKIYFMNFTGKVKTVEPEHRFSSNHYFDCKDLNGDGKPEFIFFDEGVLRVYNKDMSELFTRNFKSILNFRPIYFEFSGNDRKLGIVDKNENRIYLINNTGELYAGFPLQGNTPFSIGNFGDSLSRFSLVVGSENNFLYNYRVK
jgi:hypothetical protein